MLKLLIIDDEKTVREGLRTIIEWEKYGFKLCGEAENGIEGLKIIQEVKPDLVITDIKMPGMDGLQMVKAFKEKGEECRIIVLTGYSEFQYAKQAVALGVESYLLKPIDEDELIALVKKVYDEIVKEKRLKDYVNDSIRLTRDKIIERLLIGDMGEETIEKANQLYDMNLPWKSYQIILLDTNNSVQPGRGIRARIREAADQFINKSKYGYVLETEGMLGVLVKDACFDFNIRPIEHMCESIKEKTGMDIIASIGSYTEEMTEIGLSYERAHSLIKNKFIWGTQKIVGYKKDIADGGTKKQKTKDKDGMTDKLYIAVDVNNRENIESLLEEISQDFLAQNADENTIKTGFINIYIAIVNKLMMNNESLKKFDMDNQIYSKTNLEELKQYVKGKLLALSGELADARPDTPIRKITDYIRRNYDQDIKMENLAQIFGYNSIYLGQLFKSQTGKYFNTYLEHVRIEKAKELLKEGLKVYQVAERIGYHNLDYFSSKFKKYVGVSPSEYRESAEK